LPESLALKTGRGQKPACAILYKTFAATPTGKWHKCMPGVFETLRGADDTSLAKHIPGTQPGTKLLRALRLTGPLPRDKLTD